MAAPGRLSQAARCAISSVCFCSRRRSPRSWVSIRRSISLRMPATRVSASSSNVRARRLYAHLGFEQVGVRKGYYPDAHGQREDALVLRLAVPPEEGA